MSSGIPLGQMLDMLESNKSKNSPKKTVDGDAVTGSYPTGGTGNLPLGLSYSRLAPTSGAGLGRIQGGTRRMMELMDASSQVFSFTSLQTATQLRVSGIMIRELDRTATDPFYEAMQGFTKKAKKLSKRI